MLLTLTLNFELLSTLTLLGPKKHIPLRGNLGDLSFPEGNMTGQMINRVGTGASVRV